MGHLPHRLPKDIQNWRGLIMDVLLGLFVGGALFRKFFKYMWNRRLGE